MPNNVQLRSNIVDLTHSRLLKASRMESTGSTNRIQVSKETAELIMSMDKGHWLKKREELVEAKGKGTIQTYWVKTRASSVATATSFDGSMDSGDDSPAQTPQDVLQQSLEERRARKALVDWQVDLMSRLLKQIAYGRQSKHMFFAGRTKSPSIEGAGGALPRDEIAESIQMPAFDAKASTNFLTMKARSGSCTGNRLKSFH